MRVAVCQGYSRFRSIHILTERRTRKAGPSDSITRSWSTGLTSYGIVVVGPRQYWYIHCGARLVPFQIDPSGSRAVSYTHLRAHETKANLVCRLLLEKKKKTE